MDRKSLALVTVIVVAIIAVPLSFYTGMAVGYNNGHSSGFKAGLNEGSQAVILQIGTDIILNPGQGFLVTPHITSSSLNSSNLYFNIEAISPLPGQYKFELNLSLGSWLAYSSGFVSHLSGNYSFHNLTGNHPLNVWIQASPGNNGTVSVEILWPMYLATE